MSRSFTKNILNVMDMPNTDAALFDAPITAFSLWAFVRSVDTGSPQNFLFCVPNPGSASVGFAAILSVVGGVNRLALRGRATATDTTRTMTSTVQSFSIGQWVHFGGQIDWANDTGYLVTSGVSETIVSAGWTATAFDGGAGTGKFRLGQTSLAAASLVDTNALDGLLGEVAFWTPTSLMTAGEWAALGLGAPPFLVRPADLQIYRQLLGIDDTEPDTITHGLVTITGSVPAGASEPPVDSLFAEPSNYVEILSSAGTIGPLASRVMQMRKAA